MSTCAEAVASATVKFGPPTAVIDATNEQLFEGLDKRIDIIERETQWTKGQTRLNLKCTGLFTGDAGTKMFSLVTLSATHVSQTPAIVPMFALTCNSKVTFSDGSTSEQTPMVLHIDEHFGKVRNRQNVEVGKEVAIRPDSIFFVFVTGDLHFAHQIDRVTGMLTAVEPNAKPGAFTGTIRGMCEKTEVAARKF